MRNTASSSPVRASHHFRLRAAERGLRADVCDFILTYGSELRAAGATHLVLLRRRLPPELRDTELAQRARGWIVLLTDDGVLMTCYRRFDATSALRRKPKLRPAPRQRPNAVRQRPSVASEESFHCLKGQAPATTREEPV